MCFDVLFLGQVSNKALSVELSGHYQNRFSLLEVLLAESCRHEVETDTLSVTSLSRFRREGIDHPIVGHLG